MRLTPILFVLLSACAATAPEVLPVVQGPNGDSGWLELHCPHDPHRCRDLAVETCPSGYEEADFRVGGSGGYTSPGTMDEPIGPPDKHNQLLVRCKNEGPSPEHH